MFHAKEKIFLGVIVFLIIAIPSGALVLSQRMKINQKNQPVANPTPVTKPKEVPKTNSAKKTATPSASQTSSQSGLNIAGPSILFKLDLEGRPKEKQSSKVFIGIAQGNVPTDKQPQYILTFTVDVPDSGSYSNLSLAGLNIFETYTAFLKGSSQIATSSAFVLKPTQTDLGTLAMMTGDVNEDNVIDTADYAVTSKALGQTSKSVSWNPLLDFNLDSIVNILDLGFIKKNIGKIGASGPWYSKTVFTPATQSAVLKTPSVGKPRDATSSNELRQPIKIPSADGYWIWVPSD